MSNHEIIHFYVFEEVLSHLNSKKYQKCVFLGGGAPRASPPCQMHQNKPKGLKVAKEVQRSIGSMVNGLNGQWAQWSIGLMVDKLDG